MGEVLALFSNKNKKSAKQRSGPDWVALSAANPPKKPAPNRLTVSNLLVGAAVTILFVVFMAIENSGMEAGIANLCSHLLR